MRAAAEARAARHAVTRELEAMATTVQQSAGHLGESCIIPGGITHHLHEWEHLRVVADAVYSWTTYGIDVTNGVWRLEDAALARRAEMLIAAAGLGED
jgi:hypothetical protein